MVAGNEKKYGDWRPLRHRFRNYRDSALNKTSALTKASTP